MTPIRHPQPQAPRAIVVSGPAGAGKTTLGRALAAELGYAIVDLDTVTGPLARLALEQFGVASGDFDSPAGRRLRSLRYTTLLDVARANLELGLGAVLTAPFTTECRDEAAWAAVAALLPGDLALIHLDAPAAVLQERLRLRDEPRDHAKLSRGPLAAASGGHLVDAAIGLDATLALDRQLQAALDALAVHGESDASPPRARSATAC